MIGKVLKVITNELNLFLGGIHDPGLSSYEDKYAVIQHLKKDSFSGSDPKKIAVNLINIEEDTVYKNHITPFDRPNNSSPTHPEGGTRSMRLTLYLLFAFHPGETSANYMDALTLLSDVLKFFQTHSYLELTIPGSPSEVVGLEINYHNISLEDSNNMWSNLGGEQKPYAMYQLKLLEIKPNGPGVLVPVLETPLLSNPQLDVNGKTEFDVTTGATIDDQRNIKQKKNNSPKNNNSSI